MSLSKYTKKFSDFLLEPIQAITPFEGDVNLFDPLAPLTIPKEILEGKIRFKSKFKRKPREIEVLNKGAGGYLPVVIGEVKVGGTLVFYGSSGTDDKFLHLVIAYSEGEINDVLDTYIGDDHSFALRFINPDNRYTAGTVSVNGTKTVTGTGTSWSTVTPAPELFYIAGEKKKVDKGYKIDTIDSDTQITLKKNYEGITASGKSYTIGPSLVTLTHHSGTTTQAADADLVASYTNWTEDHQLKGIAYSNVRMEFHKNSYTEEETPNVTFIIQGIKVYDTRTSTITYNKNAALHYRNYKINTIYGLGLSTSLIDDASITTAADYYDEQIKDNTTNNNDINRFEMNGVLDTSEKVFDNINGILDSCWSWSVFVGGKYKLVADKDETPTFTFTNTGSSANIVGRKFKLTTPGQKKYLNKSIAEFRNPANDWEDDTREDRYALGADNGVVLDNTLALQYETSEDRSTYHADLDVKKSRTEIRVQFIATYEALKVEIGEVVNITRTSPAWTNKKFRVIALVLLANGLVNVGCQEHDVNVYIRNIPPQTTPLADTDLKSPFDVIAPTGLTLSYVAADNVNNLDGAIKYRIKVSWTASADQFVINYEVEYKKNADSIWEPVSVSRGTLQTHVTDLEFGVAYDVRVRAINSHGIESAWVTNLNNTIIEDANGGFGLESTAPYVHTLFESLDGFESIQDGVNPGTATLSDKGAKLQVDPANTIDTVGIRKSIENTQKIGDWAKKRILKVSVIYGGTISDDFNHWILFGDSVVNSQYVGFRLNGPTSELVAARWDGTTSTENVIKTGMAKDTLYNIKMVTDSAEIKYYVDDVLELTISSPAAYPSGANSKNVFLFIYSNVVNFSNTVFASQIVGEWRSTQYP